MLRLGLSSLYFLFLICIIKLKERVPENNWEEAVSRSFTWDRLCGAGLSKGAEAKTAGTEALANPIVTCGTCRALHSCPEFRQGGCAFVFQH